MKITINGFQVEASLEDIRTLLCPQEHPEQDLIVPEEKHLHDYDGRGPAVIPTRKSPEPYHRVNLISSGKRWSAEEDRVLLEHFPLTRTQTPPQVAIEAMKDDLPGRSTDAIQIRWYSLKNPSYRNRDRSKRDGRK